MKIRDIVNQHNRIDAMDILEAIGIEKKDIYMNLNHPLTDDQMKAYQNIQQQLEKSIPIQYILGKTTFMGREFVVHENVLIPRFDTEILVSEIVGQYAYKKVLEIGTGTGIIGLTLALENPNSHVTMVDISPACIRCANQNKKRLKVDNAEIITSNLYESIHDQYDLIISNPPYINKKDMEQLDKNVSYEPKLALFGGEDGLDFYRKIIEKAGLFLTEDGLLAFEIGYDQKDAITDLLSANHFEVLSYKKDLSGFDRAIISRRKVWKI